VKIAQKYDLHDDHYHVVLDPKKMPDDSKPVLLPATELTDGATFGGACVEQGKLVLRWHALGALKAKSVRVTCDDWTGAAKPGETKIAAGVTLEHGRTYKWKLEVELASGESIGFDWQTIKADLTAPTVEGQEPADGALVSHAPELTWKFAKAGQEQASFIIELTDQSSRKVTHRIGPVASKEASFVLRATRFARSAKWSWRVRAQDKLGDEGVSEWREFKTSPDWKFSPPSVTCAHPCDLKGADGSVVAKLKKGDSLIAVGEGDERLIVQTARGQEGFVRREDVSFAGK
jgi:hypothetical protein